MMPGYEHLRFAICAFHGTNVQPPPPPSVDMSQFSLMEWAKAKATMAADDLANSIMALFPEAYNSIHAHHQKVVLIDSEQPDARAFVIGSNFNEEYWDDHQHVDWSEERAPYAPWRDVGVMVQGPVIHDIASNIKERWSLLDEVMPDFLVAAAKQAEAAGMFKEPEINPAGKSRPLNRAFDATRFRKLFEKIPLLIAALQTAERLSPLHVLAVCAGLTLFIDMIGGLVDGSLDVNTGGISPAGAWGGACEPAEYYRRTSAHTEGSEIGLPAQFTRTFCLKNAEVEFSIVRAIYRALVKVQEGGLIYIENQYFRDLHLIQLLQYICQGFPPHLLQNGNPREGHIRPYLIVITSDFNIEPKEGRLSQGPSFIAYQMLKSSGIPFHLCCLRTKSRTPEIPIPGKRYLEPRDMLGQSDLVFDGIWEVCKALLIRSPLVLLLLRSRFRNLRDALWAALPLLLSGARRLPDIPALLAAVDHVIVRLLGLSRDKDPKTELGQELEGLTPEHPDYPDPLADNVWKAWDRNMPRTLAGVPVPPLTKDADGRDPGAIYVHSKVLIVDQAFAMVGSANHNERSMWHDTEDMIGARGFQTTHFPAELRKQLLATVLAGDMPKDDSGEEIFKHFTVHLNNNAENYIDNKQQESFVFPFIPEAAFGSFVLS
jgi:hypothetical protein